MGTKAKHEDGSYYELLTLEHMEELEGYLDAEDVEGAKERWRASGSRQPLMAYVYDEALARSILYSRGTPERLDRAMRLMTGHTGPLAVLVETLMDKYVNPLALGTGGKKLWALCAGLGGDQLFREALGALPPGARIEDPGPGWGDQQQGVYALALMVRAMPDAAFPGGGSRQERDALIEDFSRDLLGL